MVSHKIISALIIGSLCCGSSWALAQQDNDTAANQTQNQVSPDVKEINWIGFQQLADGSRIFVRTNEPVNYRIQPNGEAELVLNIFNAYLVTETFKYPMDCSYFDSPVLSIRTETLEDITPSVQVIITLRASVPYQVKQEGNLVYLDFNK